MPRTPHFPSAANGVGCVWRRHRMYGGSGWNGVLHRRKATRYSTIFTRSQSQVMQLRLSFLSFSTLLSSNCVHVPMHSPSQPPPVGAKTPSEGRLQTCVSVGPKLYSTLDPEGFCWCQHRKYCAVVPRENVAVAGTYGG